MDRSSLSSLRRLRPRVSRLHHLHSNTHTSINLHTRARAAYPPTYLPTVILPG